MRFLHSLPQSLAAITVAASLAAPLGSAYASTAEKLDLSAMLDKSDLVFEGTVVAVEYKTSVVVEKGDLELPHTFVTFAIADVVKGSSSAGQFVTVRFLGGPDGKGRVLEVAGVPKFAMGDRDVLFVRNEQSAICPVVGLEGGRYRIVRGEVFDAFGNALWFTPEGRFVTGDESVDLAISGYPTKPIVKETEGVAKEPPAGSLRPDAAGLKAMLRLRNAFTHAGAGAPKSTVFASASLGDVLRFPRPRVVTPAAAKQKNTAPKVDRAADPAAKDAAR